MQYRNDCRYFNGEKPCKFKCEYDGCVHFEPFGTRILIIKLGAIGDVLRTTPLLPVLKQKYPQSHITWVVEELGAPLLADNPYIDKILTPGLDTLTRLLAEEYDVMICLDKIDRATALATKVNAKQKLGFGMTPQGTMMIFNPEAEYALMLGISDRLKFHENEKAYQHVTFEALGLPYEHNEYVLEINADEKAWAEEWRARRQLPPGNVIGVNTGAGPTFAGKAWRVPGIAELCLRLHREMGAKILLLGGPQEGERNRQIMEMVGDAAIDMGCDNSLQRFVAIVNMCDTIVTGDTTCMHIGIALRKKVVVFFGSTCAQEIDLYGRGEKLVTRVDCAPCYLKRCPIGEICMDDITVDDVYAAVRRWHVPGTTERSSRSGRIL